MTKLTQRAAVIIVIVGALSLLSALPKMSYELGPIPQATAEIALRRSDQEVQLTQEYLNVVASEVVSDTRTTHALQRQKEHRRFERGEVAESAIVYSGAFSMSLILLAISVWGAVSCAASATGKIRRARLIPLPDQATVLQLPSGEWRVIDARAGGRNKSAAADNDGSELAARDVREFQAITMRAVASALVEALKPPKQLPPPS